VEYRAAVVCTSLSSRRIYTSETCPLHNCTHRTHRNSISAVRLFVPRIRKRFVLSLLAFECSPRWFQCIETTAYIFYSKRHTGLQSSRHCRCSKRALIRARHRTSHTQVLTSLRLSSSFQLGLARSLRIHI
jgi:hypothetical protein